MLQVILPAALVVAAVRGLKRADAVHAAVQPLACASHVRNARDVGCLAWPRVCLGANTPRVSTPTLQCWYYHAKIGEVFSEPATHSHPRHRPRPLPSHPTPGHRRRHRSSSHPGSMRRWASSSAPQNSWHLLSSYPHTCVCHASMRGVNGAAGWCMLAGWPRC